MKVVLKPASKADIHIVHNLGGGYVYEMSRECGERSDFATPGDGLFACRDWSYYWEKPAHYPFLIYVDDELAGFALVNNEGSTPDVDFNMGEFFIVAKFQRKGVGKKAAFQLFAQFNGTWEVMQMPLNRAAVKFWEKIVSEYTQGLFDREEKMIPNPTPHPMIVLGFNGRGDDANNSRIHS